MVKIGGTIAHREEVEIDVLPYGIAKKVLMVEETLEEEVMGDHCKEWSIVHKWKYDFNEKDNGVICEIVDQRVKEGWTALIYTNVTRDFENKRYRLTYSTEIVDLIKKPILEK